MVPKEYVVKILNGIDMIYESDKDAFSVDEKTKLQDAYLILRKYHEKIS